MVTLMLGIMGRGLERATFCRGVELSYCLVTVRALTETWYQECEQRLIILLLSICYRSDFLWSCLSVSVESRRSLKHTARDLRAKTLQNHELNMSEEGAEAAAPAQDQNQGFFTGNIMNFGRPKFDFRQENPLEALKAFKKKCGYIFKGRLVNISNERKCILVQDWLGP